VNVASSSPDARRSLEGDRRQKALIVKFGQIGDVIMAIPAVSALHAQGFEIDWLCGKAARPLLECYSWIRVISVDDAAILCGRPTAQALAIVRFLSQVIWTRYDVCATLYYDRRFHLLTLPIRARRRVVLSRQSRSTTLLHGRHHTDEYRRVLLATEDSCKEESCPPVRPDRLPEYRWPASTALKRIAIVPGGTKNVLGEQVLRRWPIENYVLLTRRMLDRNWEVVLLGGEDDAWIRTHFDRLPVTDCVGKLSLPEVISACDDCHAVVSHDTGPLHVAGLSKASLIGIFGPTDPATRLPRRHSSVGIWGGQGFACRPCYDGRDFAPCQFNGCMHQVIPELVLRELDRLLSDRERGVPSPWRIVVPEPVPDAGLASISGVLPAPR
jgi:heptosyltransferase-2